MNQILRDIVQKMNSGKNSFFFGKKSNFNFLPREKYRSIAVSKNLNKSLYKIIPAKTF